MPLDLRKEQILKAVTREYIATAEPVSSALLERRYNLDASSATIRNEMMELELLGYLKQPHHAAGRIPTDKGYRFYVDSLMEVERLSPAEKRMIEEEYEVGSRAIEQFLDQTAKILSQAAHCASMVTTPMKNTLSFRRLELIPLEEGRVLMVLLASTGAVWSQVVQCEGSSRDELEWASKALNQRLSGVPLARISSFLLEEVAEEIFQRLAVNLLEGISRTMKAESCARVLVGGTSNLLDQPEFRDLQKVKGLLELIEEERRLTQVLHEGMRERGVTIRIGSENPFRELQECSIITSSYHVGTGAVGSLGILGPTRMPYAKLVSLVRYVAGRLSEELTSRDRLGG